MDMTPIGLSSPWVVFYRKVEALFKDDPEIKIVYDEQNREIALYVDNDVKARALQELLPVSRTFGNVTIYLTVYPANAEASDGLSIFKAAFEGNPAFKYVTTSPKIAVQYVVFENKVVQFFNDSLSDAHGICSTLYQDIAKDIFGTDCGVYFCTDIKDAESPVKEWP